MKELRTFTGKGSSPQGLAPHPQSPQLPPSTLGRRQHLSWNTSTDEGEKWHSSSSFYFWAALLSWYRFLSSNHRYQFQSMATKIKLNKEARRSKQKGGQTTTATGLRRWRQAIENLCLLRHAGSLRARLRYPEEVHTLPVLPSQWSQPMGTYFPCLYILKTIRMDLAIHSPPRSPTIKSVLGVPCHEPRYSTRPQPRLSLQPWCPCQGYQPLCILYWPPLA